MISENIFTEQNIKDNVSDNNVILTYQDVLKTECEKFEVIPIETIEKVEQSLMTNENIIDKKIKAFFL